MIRKILTLVVFPVVLIGLGVLGAAAVFQIAPPAARAETSRTVRAVEVIEASPSVATARVDATGTVVAARRANLSPEVSGRIIKRSSTLVPGSLISEGDPLIWLDPRDYRLAITQEEARLSTAELQLETERGRRQVASTEWEIFGDGRPRDQVPLAMREPHLRAATANLAAARSSVQRARINLSRTVLRAPWNAIVIEAQAEEGQLVGPSSRVATLVGTDDVWVRASVPLGRLTDLEVPGLGNDEGSSARVVLELDGGRTMTWQGEIFRLEGELEAETRTARVLIRVDDPFETSNGSLPLLPGSFVRVELEGRALADIYTLPRAALREGSSVWVVNEDDRLEQRSVEVGWGTADEVSVTAGLSEGDRLVISPLASPLNGEQVRVQERSI